MRLGYMSDYGFSVDDAVVMLEWAGYTVKPPSQHPKHREIEALVRQGASLNEIRKTTGADPRTVKRYFPEAGWDVGGGGEAAEIKKANAMLRRIDDNGRLRSRRNNY